MLALLPDLYNVNDVAVSPTIFQLNLAVYLALNLSIKSIESYIKS